MRAPLLGVVCFFFYCYGALRDLPSFPTRRSSDLLPLDDPKTYALLSEAKTFGVFQLESARSEEHTSELQSRGHLVCRLLLEKKNRNNRYLTAAYRSFCFTHLCSLTIDTFDDSFTH